MRINTNVTALSAFRNLNSVQNAVSSSMEKLSSGFRINKAADDAAGLGIANKLQADTRGYTQAANNAQQADSVLQVAEGGVNEIQKIVQRMKELGTQAASDNTDDAGRASIKAEYDQLVSEIDSLTATTKFGSSALLDGTFGTSVDTNTSNSTILAAGQGVYSATLNGAAAGTYTVTDETGSAGELKMTINGVSQTITGITDGKQDVTFDKFGITLHLDANYTANTDGGSGNGTIANKDLKVTGTTGSFLVSSSGAYTSNDLVSLSSIDVTTGSTGLDLNSLTFTGNGTTAQWQAALTKFDSALDTVNTALGTIGAAQNRIGYALDNAQSSIQNFTAAESVIRDVDMAQEMTNFSKNQILAQAGTAMLAQANSMTSNVLTLLKG